MISVEVTNILHLDVAFSLNPAGVLFSSQFCYGALETLVDYRSRYVRFVELAALLSWPRITEPSPR
jgi:hypothetical protein